MFTSFASKLISLQNLALAALAVVVVSGAYVNQGTLAGFNATKTNATNTISTATLDLTAVPNGGADGGSLNVPVTDFIPGDWVQKGVAVANTGNIAASLTLTIADANPGGSASHTTLKGTDANNSLKLTVERCMDNTYTTCGGGTGYVVVGGSNVNATVIGNVLGTASTAVAMSKAGAGSDTLYFRIRLELPSTADNTVKSATSGEKAAAFNFNWVLTQTGTGSDRTAG
jgi:hypothetical protein